MKIAALLLIMFSLFFAAVQPAMAAERTYKLSIRNHMFEPTQMEVPAGKKFVLHVLNHDDVVEEFESPDLGVERILPAQGDTKIMMGPLKSGVYPFIGSFFPETAIGILVVIE